MCGQHNNYSRKASLKFARSRRAGRGLELADLYLAVVGASGVVGRVWAGCRRLESGAIRGLCLVCTMAFGDR